MRPTTLPTRWILILLPLLLVACGDDDDPASPDVPDPPLAAGEIGPGGGWIGNESVSLAVPAGALDRTTTLAIHDETGAAPLDRTTAPVYRLEGLPEQLAAPLTLRFRHGVHADSTKAFLRGEERVSRSAGRNLTWQAAAFADSAGWCVAELATGPPALGDKDVAALLTALVDGLVPYTEPDAHFSIWYDSADLGRDEADELLARMEMAFAGIEQQLGFHFGAQDTIWPLHAYMVQPTESVAAYYYGRHGKGFFQFPPWMMDIEELTDMIIVHEVFHCAQQWYDPRPPEEWLTSNERRRWLDEATASYVEMFEAHSVHRPGSMSGELFKVPYGGFQPDPELTLSGFGYGMSSFIEYVCSRQGNGRLLEIYEEFALTGDAVTSLQNVLDPAPESWIADYHQQLTDGQIYHFGPDANVFWNDDYEIMAGDVGNWRQPTVVVPDLGAARYQLRIDPASEGETASRLRVRAAEDFVISVWTVGIEHEPDCLAAGEDSVTVSGVGEFGPEAERLLILLSKPWAESDAWIWSTETILDIELLGDDDLASLVEVDLGIGVQGQWDDGAEGGVYTGCDNHDLAGWYGTVTVDGDTYQAAWDYETGDGDNRHVGEITIVFARPSLDIASFSCSFEVTGENGYLRNGQLSGGPLALSSGGVGSGLTYEVTGATVCSVLDGFTHQYRFNQYAELRTLLSYGCDAESYLTIELGPD